MKTNETRTDFRALCQELMDAIDSGVPVERIKQSPLAVRVDAALAQPEPVALTDEELDGLFDAHCYTDDFGTHLMDAACFRDGARAALAQPEPQGPSVEVMAQIVYENAMLATAPEHAKPHWPSWNDLPNSDARIHSLNTAEIILARWGRPASKSE